MGRGGVWWAFSRLTKQEQQGWAGTIPGQLGEMRRDPQPPWLRTEASGRGQPECPTSHPVCRMWGSTTCYFLGFHSGRHPHTQACFYRTLQEGGNSQGHNRAGVKPKVFFQIGLDPCLNQCGENAFPIRGPLVDRQKHVQAFVPGWGSNITENMVTNDLPLHRDKHSLPPVAAGTLSPTQHPGEVQPG